MTFACGLLFDSFWCDYMSRDEHISTVNSFLPTHFELLSQQNLTFVVVITAKPQFFVGCSSCCLS